MTKSLESIYLDTCFLKYLICVVVEKSLNIPASLSSLSTSHLGILGNHQHIIVITFQLHSLEYSLRFAQFGFFAFYSIPLDGCSCSSIAAAAAIL